MRKKHSKKEPVFSAIKSKRGMIREALRDLNREILIIRKQKIDLNNQIRGADKNLDNFIAIEKSLQKKIAELGNKEASLKERKKKIFQNEERLMDRLSKIQKIKSELDEI